MKVKDVNFNFMAVVLTLVLIALKIDGFIDIPWVFVIAPLWITTAIGLVLLLYAGTLWFIFYILKLLVWIKRKVKK